MTRTQSIIRQLVERLLEGDIVSFQPKNDDDPRPTEGNHPQFHGLLMSHGYDLNNNDPIRGALYDRSDDKGNHLGRPDVKAWKHVTLDHELDKTSEKYGHSQSALDSHLTSLHGEPAGPSAKVLPFSKR